MHNQQLWRVPKFVLRYSKILRNLNDTAHSQIVCKDAIVITTKRCARRKHEHPYTRPVSLMFCCLFSTALEHLR